MFYERARDPSRYYLLLFSVVFMMSICLVTFFNTYRILVLEKEISELKRNFKTCNPGAPVAAEDTVQRRKRSIIGATEDGVLVSSESYAQRKRENITHQRYPGFKGLSIVPLVTAKPSYFGSYVSPEYDTKKPTVHVRSSRVMHFEDKSKAFRQVVKKSALRSGDSYYSSNEYAGSSESEFPVIRDEGVVVKRNRQRMETLDERHPKTGRIKPLPSIHFSGDTSKYVLGQHDNFKGNGHLRHPQKTFVDWTPDKWVKRTGMDTHFVMDNGNLMIQEPGIYFVYAQIYYLDEHDINGYRVYKNGETILQCTLASHTVDRRLKGNTCYTAGANFFAQGDRISLGDIVDGRYSLFEPGKSFFGVIKLGDARARM